MTLGLGAHDGQGRALAEFGQAALLLGHVLLALGLLLVPALLIGGEEAAEGDDGAGGTELDLTRGRLAIQRRAQLHRRGRATGIGHLRGDRPLPDQLVEREVLAPQFSGHLRRRPEAVARGADRLVRLLRTLGLGRVAARRIGHVVRAIEIPGLLPGGGEGGLGQGHRVRSHVGDVAVLVEPLRDPHRVLRREPEFARRLLLQRRRRERRRRPAGVRLLRDRGDGHVGGAHGIRNALRPRPVEVGDLGVGEGAVVGEITAGGHPLAVDAREPRGEEVALAVGSEVALDVPVVGGDEGHPLALALDDQARRDGLHSASRQAGAHLAPQHGRHLIAIEPVEDAAGLLGIDEGHVDVAGVVGGALDGFLGDLVEDHALDGDLGLQGLLEVPGDRLALAVLIRGEVELVGRLQRPLELGDLLLLVGVDDVVGREVVVDVDAEPPERPALDLGRHLARRGDVADVADGGLDEPVLAQIARDRLGLGRALDDDQFGPAHA